MSRRILIFLAVIYFVILKLDIAIASESIQTPNHLDILNINEINLLLDSDSSKISTSNTFESSYNNQLELDSIDKNYELNDMIINMTNNNEYFDELDLNYDLQIFDENIEYNVNNLLENENEILENNQYNNL